MISTNAYFFGSRAYCLFGFDEKQELQGLAQLLFILSCVILAVLFMSDRKKSLVYGSGSAAAGFFGL